MRGVHISVYVAHQLKYLYWNCSRTFYDVSIGIDWHEYPGIGSEKVSPMTG